MKPSTIEVGNQWSNAANPAWQHHYRTVVTYHHPSELSVDKAKVVNPVRIEDIDKVKNEFPKVDLFDSNNDGKLDARDTLPENMGVSGIKPRPQTVVQSYKTEKLLVADVTKEREYTA